MFFIFGQVINSHPILYQFGFKYESNFISLVLFSKLYEVISWITSLISTLITRTFEYQADAFAARDDTLRLPLCRALIKIHINNASNLNPDPVYAALNFSHPQLSERLAALRFDPDDSDAQIEEDEIYQAEKVLDQLANQGGDDEEIRPAAGSYHSLNEEIGHD